MFEIVFEPEVKISETREWLKFETTISKNEINYRKLVLPIPILLPEETTTSVFTFQRHFSATIFLGGGQWAINQLCAPIYIT